MTNENEITLPPLFTVTRPSMPRFPELVLDQFDVETLAREYLEKSIDLFSFSFFTGNCEEAMAQRLWDRFETVVAVLGEVERQRFIDELDFLESKRQGDDWQVFKSTWKPGFFSTPADQEAIKRLATSILDHFDNLDDDAFSSVLDRYGLDFLAVLEKATGRSLSGSKADICDGLYEA